MKKQTKRKAGFLNKLRSGLTNDNPVFVSGLALPFCIVPSTTLMNGLVMGAAVIAATLPTAIIAAAIGKKVKKTFQLPLYSTVSMACVLWLMYQLKIKLPDAIISVGIYMPLAAVNTIMLETCYRDDQKSKIAVIINSIRLSIGFTVAIVFISAVREFVTFNTLLGINTKIQIQHQNAFSLPFFGFLLIGFIAALINAAARENHNVQFFKSDEGKGSV